MDCPAIISELQNALSLIMSPSTDPNLRRTAYQYCEDFKERSDDCAECGVFMAKIENDQIVRHFGLQLLEHTVKFKWNGMSLEKKGFIKTNTLSLISSGTLGITSEHGHIKDALSRIVVEIAKREWPQQWMSMIKELDDISIQGMTQTEIILMVFLRLVEDVLIFQTTPAQRRKEILQGLIAIMQNLFNFFCSTLSSNYEAFKMNRLELGYARVMSVTCEVICSFMENLSIGLLTSGNGSLIFLLLEMLQEPQLNMAAADCLLEIAGKKGKVEERVPLVEVFFSLESLNKLEQVAIMSDKNCGTEQGFQFFKKLCQLLVVLGTQICSILSFPSGKLPANFDKYVGLMFSFTIHPSQVISCYCMPLWLSLLKCERVSGLEVIKHYFSQFLASSLEMMIRVGSLAQDDHVKCTYARFDFDCEEEFAQFQRKYKTEVCDVVKVASTLYPEVAFELITSRLTHTLNKTFAPGLDGATLSLLYLEWEAVASCLEAVLEKMDFKSMDNKLVLSTIILYKQILDFHTPDPILCSHILSVVSAFFSIIAQDTSILPKVLDKLFSCIQFNMAGQTKSTRSKVVKNVRRHSCSILIKICKMYPDVLLPGFNYLYNHIKKLSTDPEALSQMEKCTCYEALILIHNQVKNYNEQTNFLREIIEPVSSYWLSDSLTETLWSSDKLMDFIGVTRPPVEPSSQDVCGINRSQIQYCLSFILAVLKRSAWPSTVEEAQAGGFIQGYNSDSSPIYRSPATEIIIPLLNNVFGIIKSYHEFLTHDKQRKIYPNFLPACVSTGTEKSVILGISKPMGSHSDASVATTKDPVERMQAFLNTLREAGYNILGSCCKHLNQEFYSFPNLAEVVLGSVLSNVFTQSECKIKQLLHTFLKPLVMHCPKQFYSSVLLVILKATSPFFYQYFTSKWQVMNNKRNENQDAGQDYSDSQEGQELLEEQLLKSLTREYFEFLDCILRDRKSSAQQPQSSNGAEVAADDVAMDDVDVASLSNSRKGKEEVLGELGQLVLQHDDVYPPIVFLIFISLSWEDTPVCAKTVIWCYPILKQLMALQKVAGEYTTDFFRSLLSGLNVHGQHDTVLFIIISALVQTYELLIPHFPGVREIMLNIPGCTEESLDMFNARFINTSSQNRNFEKKKREFFKSLVEGAIEVG